jgi:serine protease AprX
MATTRVIAYFMHENEAAAARAALASADFTDSFATGEIDEAKIPELERAGLIVHALDEPPAQQHDSPALAAASLFAMAAPLAAGGAASLDDRFSDALPQPVDDYIVTLRGPLLEQHRDALTALGVTLRRSVGPSSYKVRLKSEQVPQVKALPFVADVQWFVPQLKVPPVAAQAIGGAASLTGAPEVTFDAKVDDPDKVASVRAWIEAQGLTVLATGKTKVRFTAAADADELNELTMVDGVERVEEYVQPEAFNSAARRILGLETAAAGAVSATLPYDGDGQIAGVADTGIDVAHPDFQGRIEKTIARGRTGANGAPGDVSDPVGHGTHVSGSILGDGSASGGELRGVAPKAKLVFQSLLDANGTLGGLPTDLGELFGEAYALGVRVHNNSWGAKTPSTYAINSEEVDAFVRDHPDMLILIAAGNFGTGPTQNDRGCVDWLSIGSPGSCKNALTVGASRSDRTDGAFSTMTWSAFNSAFKDPLGGETVSGQPDALAGFSSRGPCDDRRIKPDLVAPGTDIASAKSSLAPIENFWGPYPKQAPHDPHYAFDGGTSMATPLVAGCAILVRQYYTDVRKHAPSAALLKATLINGTVWLAATDSTAPKPGRPNYHQGHGRLDMRLALPAPSDPAFALEFVDDWETPAKSLVRTGQRRRFQFTLPAAAPELRLCLAYTDVPGRALQNSVSLLLQHQQSATKWLPNPQLPDGFAGRPDADNNVQSIRVENAAAGTYFIQVFAANLLKPPQDFALVVTAQGLSPLTEI